MTKRTRYLAVAAVLIALAGGAALLALPSLTDVRDAPPDARPYAAGHVAQVRIADAVTVYVDDETRFSVGPGLVSGIALVAMATACAMTALLLTASGRRGRARLFYAIAAGGLGYLAVDELAGIHETIGHNLPFLADLPGVERPDDAVFASYLVPTAVVAVLFRDVLRASSLALRLFAAGAAGFVLSALLDVAGSSLDNPVELLTSGLLGAGLVALMIEHLTAGLQLPRPSPSGRAAAASAGAVRPARLSPAPSRRTAWRP